MSRPVMGVGVVLVLMGVLAAVAPDQLLSIVAWKSRQGLYVAAGMRILLGLILILFGSSTRYPKGLRIFGGVVLVAGLGLLFVPIDFWAGLIQYWLFEKVAFFRVGGGLFATLFGAFLVYASLPERPAT